MTSVMETVASSDARIAARVDGDSHRPWIVLSNSLATNLTMWDDQISSLTRSHRILRYDTRGHGDSSASPGPYSFDMLVADLIAVMNHFDVDRADVLGLSLGGMTALGVGLAHPGRVNRLVCASARADAPPAFVTGWDQRIDAVATGGTGTLLAGTMERWFTTATRQTRPDVIDRASRMLLSTSAAGYIGCAHALKNLDYLRHLGSLAPPTMYIAGAEDMGAPVEAMRAMAAATPGSVFRILDGVAHIANMEDIDGFNALLSGFLPISTEPAGAHR